MCIRDSYAAVEKYVADCKGVLHEKKYTEYSRVVLALTAIGADPADVAGYNLLTPLGDFDKTVWQGINGPIWALIALDSGDYEMPVNETAATQATRQMYVEEILSKQMPDGGWSLSAQGGADADVTAMALQALAPYQNQSKVKTAVERGLACLSDLQGSDGGGDRSLGIFGDIFPRKKCVQGVEGGICSAVAVSHIVSAYTCAICA